MEKSQTLTHIITFVERTPDVADKTHLQRSNTNLLFFQISLFRRQNSSVKLFLDYEMATKNKCTMTSHYMT